jgi:acyl carrier protein
MSFDRIVLSAIIEAVKEFNSQRPEEKQINSSPDTVLFGEGGKLDSLGLVDFIVTVEETIEEICDRDVTVVDERAMSQDESPLRTIGTLTNYLKILINDKSV